MAQASSLRKFPQFHPSQFSLTSRAHFWTRPALGDKFGRTQRRIPANNVRRTVTFQSDPFWARTLLSVVKSFEVTRIHKGILKTMSGNESIEDLLTMLYQAQLRMFLNDCERVFAPLEDLSKDEEFGAKDELVFAV